MPTHTNRLAQETSPYLLQHAHNSVEWFPWGEEALARAKEEDKPIFLSVGYSACHWCHVMERESFEDEGTAALMNKLFVNIKVDREERPDIDAIYMEAVQAMTSHGGWPMSVFLTPEGQPFYGGTYYPPEPRYGMPSFQQVLASVADAYENRGGQVREQAQRLTETISRTARLLPQEQDLSTATLDEAVVNLLQYFDEEEGGFGGAPKFPQPMTLDFAMSQYSRTGDLDTLYIAELTLQKMAAGGMYDQIGGGFHRYSVDAVWLVPHFEKMLYDNAQLLRSYLLAYQLTGQLFYRQVVEETIDYVLREMTTPSSGTNVAAQTSSGTNVAAQISSGFYSTQDADSEGEEGKFFVWTPEEIDAILGEERAQLFNAYYGVSSGGNFEGKNILNISSSVAQVATRFAITAQTVEDAIREGDQLLFAAREERIKPGRDEKILTEWNGLMIHALAECGVVLGRQDALDAAQDAASFILAKMSQEDGRLLRSYKDGRAKFNAYLEDYAAFIRALIALYEATFDLRWLGEASRLARVMIEQFSDPQPTSQKGELVPGYGFFQTGKDHEQLVVRRKDFVDNAVPSGNSMAAEALLRLSVLTGNNDYRTMAQNVLLVMKDAMRQQPTGFGRLLGVLNAFLAPSREIAIVGNPADEATQALLAEVRQRYLPNTVVALKRPDEESVLPVLQGRTLVDGKPAAYVCENYACKLPVTTPEELAALLT